MATFLIVWGLPAGETDRAHEVLLAETCRTDADVERVKAAAGRDGWHGFRVSRFTEGDMPDFIGAINGVGA
jgi:hypothetical protein